jgi:DNA-binding NarL/FixJ family response regulator
VNSILICDDHALVREAISATLRAVWPDADIVEAGSFIDAWKRAAEGFELCICDLMMPGAEPEHGIKQLKRAVPDMPILILTGKQDDALMLRLMEIGVNGFVHKDTGSAVMLAAIQLIAAGERHVPARVLGMMARPSGDAAMPVRLTDQQRKVVTLVAQGMSNKSIAQSLGVAPSTIKSHLEQAMRMTATTSRFEAANRARQAGLI